MSKEEILGSFGQALQQSGAEKSGNLLAEDLRRRASVVARTDRAGLVEAVREWLCSEDEVLALQAVILVREFHLAELREETERIRKEVASGKFMAPSWEWVFEKTLSSLT